MPQRLLRPGVGEHGAGYREMATPTSGPRPVRARFFKIYRAVRIRSASAAVSPRLHLAWVARAWHGACPVPPPPPADPRNSGGGGLRRRPRPPPFGLEAPARGGGRPGAGGATAPSPSRCPPRCATSCGSTAPARPRRTLLGPGRRPCSPPGARFRQRWPAGVHMAGRAQTSTSFGKIGYRPSQSGAGTGPARRKHRSTSAGETALPGIPETLRHGSF
eukprot:gene21639-biopygen8672